MSLLISILAFAVVILVCVGFHEFGHFVMAKLCGIRVDEFAIGFGPRLASWGRGETKYSIRALPLGGFVRMAGMLGLKGEADAGPRNFYRASIPKRLVVMLAGIAFNFVLALVMFTVSYSLPNPSTVISTGPAALAGIHDGDSVISIGGMPIDHSSYTAVQSTTENALNKSGGQPTDVVYTNSDGSRRTTRISPQLGILNDNATNPHCDTSKLPQGNSYITAINGNSTFKGDPQSLLGEKNVRVSGRSVANDSASPCGAFAFSDVPFPGLNDSLRASWKIGMTLDFPGESLPAAIGNSADYLWNFIPMTATSIGIVSSTPDSGGVFGPNGLQGPVGIAQEAGQTAQQGLKADLFFIGVISMNLGYLNLVPIPFLDGGKILFVVLEAVRRKRLTPEREAAIYAGGLAFIILLVIYITIGNLRSH